MAEPNALQKAERMLPILLNAHNPAFLNFDGPNDPSPFLLCWFAPSQGCATTFSYFGNRPAGKIPQRLILWELFVNVLRCGITINIWRYSTKMQNHVHTAILPVAGLGTRLMPATKSVPKELLPVYDRPLLQYAVDEARASGIKRLVLVNHPSKSAIQHYFERDNDLRDALEAADKTHISDTLDRLDPTDDMEVVFVNQSEQKGLGHAIWCARDIARGRGPVAVLLPDDLILGQPHALAEMARAYDAGFAGHMVGAKIVAEQDVNKYGICDCDTPAPGRQVRISGVVEKPDPDDAPSRVAVIGRYILDESIFDALEHTEPGAGGEIQLTDAIASAIGDQGVSAFHITGERHDCGHADGLLSASTAVRDLREGAVSSAA